MARQKGLMKYVGTIGDVRHFKIKGQEGFFAGMVGGPTAEQVKSAPEFERTRENMNEFGGCAKVGKSLRTALSALMGKFTDSQVTGRLTSVMKKINLEDGTEARGYRKVEVSTQRKYLEGFEFNKNLSISGIFNAPYDVTHTAGRDSSDFVIAPFNPADLISAPSGSTHFRLINALAVLSDFSYNPTTGSYEPDDMANNELTIVEYSGYIPLNTAYAGSTITAQFPGTPTLGANVSVVQCIGIEFFQEVNSQYYPFASGNCLKIEEVF
ncbi:hypothetical protein [Chryseobacterium oryzae]|uniref:Uncharacterized protein n=1 Tax=Chryseobacterium oryzae TaxID=2929799 RepID=A0ABY4BJ09_9FLAO|nr:hypothetical protein [Chryseobacterium oryzae]UOE39168.1 hypothetical protein MTP08_05205 [Chryseobacterium oryzae]